MHKKITKEQVERLYGFTREHFVEYYDLQAELADHLANGIEERWQRQPDLDFEQALQLEFKKFGIFGFSDIVEKRHWALSKRYYRFLLQNMMYFFKIPQIIATSLAAIMIYKLLEYSSLIYYILMIVVTVISTVRLGRIRKSYNKKIKRTGRKWLLEEIIFSCGSMTSLLYLPIYISHIYLDGEALPGQLWLLTVLSVLVIIYDYVVLVTIPAKAEEYLGKSYPEYSVEISR